MAFQALPFAEPATGLVYGRNRWFDPESGTWLSPDPHGYEDSSNLYAFCGGDPVNCTDPLGAEGFWKEAGKTLWGYGKGVGKVVVSPGILTYNLTGALLYKTTGGKQYLEQYATTAQIGRALGAIDSPKALGNAVLQGFTASVDQMVECANRGDAECVGEGLGTFVGQTLLAAEAGGSTTIGRAPATALATNTGTVIRAGAGVVVRTPKAPLLAPVLASAVNKSGESGESETGPQQQGETGAYKDVGGHHVHAKAGFKGHSSYDPNLGFSISQEYMKSRGWSHEVMTATQQKLFRELAGSGGQNVMREHTRIAVDALKKAGATQAEAQQLVIESLRNLRAQKVYQPTRIPWQKK